VSDVAGTVVRTSEPAKLRVRRRVREVYERREVLLNLVRKELKVKYTASVLGAVWSLLNPIVFLAVFTFVVKVTHNSFPHFPIYLLSGLLAWNLFSVRFYRKFFLSHPVHAKVLMRRRLHCRALAGELRDYCVTAATTTLSRSQV